MAHGFVQVPPQSTGKRVFTEERTVLHFNTSTIPFEKGDVVVGATSGATGIVSGVDTEGYSPTEGDAYLEQVTGTFINGENLQVSAVTYAVAVVNTQFPSRELAVQGVSITDPNNLKHTQRVDRFGAGVTTFNTGQPNFGAFGTMLVGEPVPIASYNFHYDNQEKNFYTEIVGTASTSAELQAARSLLSCGTASGDRVTRTSHYYAPYNPGVGNQFVCTVQIGDSGKTNVIRRWGQYDDDNGFFWELDGTTLSVVLRSNTTGSPVETRINQVDFNQNKLDGTDGINFDLDLTKGNIFWIDYQWLGTGRVRFGVFDPRGDKATAHTIENANINPSWPYSRTATLPFRYEQFNSGPSASTSEMRVVCCNISHSSGVNSQYDKHTTDSGFKAVATASGEIPIIAVRPKTSINGVINRTVWRGRQLQCYNAGSEPIRLCVYSCNDGTALTNPSWASVSDHSTTEADIAATTWTLGPECDHLITYIVPPGQLVSDRKEPDSVNREYELYLNADSVTQPLLFITAECLTGTTTNVMVVINWDESRV